MLLCGSVLCPAQNTPPTLDDLLELTPEAPGSRERGASDERAGDLALQETVRRVLSSEQASGLFEQVVQEMEEASVRLGRQLNPGLQTQRLQKSVLEKLDQLIAAARRRSPGSQSSGSGSDGARGQDSGGAQMTRQSVGSGQTQVGASGSGHSGEFSPGSANDAGGDQSALEELRMEWGYLPKRLRDELSEGFRERFSPMYRALTEAYYRRLAEDDQ